MESCSIEVGNSVNIKRSDGECQDCWKKSFRELLSFRKRKNGFYDQSYNYLGNDFLLSAESESLRSPRMELALQWLVKHFPDKIIGPITSHCEER